MNTTTIGRNAEKQAAAYLQANGFNVIRLNWYTRRCEIDIIAYKQPTMHFIEVKYRSTTMQGTGSDYITAAKQRQMSYSAQTWVAQNGWHGEYALSVIGVDSIGNIDFIESIT